MDFLLPLKMTAVISQLAEEIYCIDYKSLKKFLIYACDLNSDYHLISYNLYF